MVAFWASKLRDILMGPLPPSRPSWRFVHHQDQSGWRSLSWQAKRGPRVITSYKGGSWHVMAAFLRRNGRDLHSKSLPVDLGWLGAFSILQISPISPSSLQETSEKPRSFCQDSFGNLPLDSFRSDTNVDLRRLDQRLEVVPTISSYSLLYVKSVFSKMLQVNLLHSICKTCFFFSKKMVPSDVSRHAFIPPASPGPRLSCRLQASRSCSRWCSPVASLENSWESLAWRARTWRLGPVFPKFWSLWPRKGHAWHNHSIYTYRHTNIYI